MKSASKGGDIGQSKIPRTQEGALVPGMSYDADSAFTFTSNGIDLELENLDVQPGKEVLDLWEPRPPPSQHYQNDASTPPASRLPARTQPIPLVPREIIGSVVGFGQFPAPLPPQRPTLHTRESRPFIAQADSSSRRRSMTVPNISSHSASHTSSAPISIPRQGSRPVDLSYEVATGVWQANLGNQTGRLPSQNGTAPWILASRAPHAPKKPEDAQFLAYMDNLRKKTKDSDASTGSTPRSILIGDRVQSVRSSAFSESFSVASPPPAVAFSPTPVFKDEGLMRMVRSPPF